MRYLGHGTSRVVYKLDEGRVLKLCRKNTPGANDIEVSLAKKFPVFVPRLLGHGVAWYVGSDSRQVNYLVMEEVVLLSGVFESKPASEHFGWLAKVAMYIVELARAGVRASDCKVSNLGVVGDGVVALDFATYTVQVGAVSKGNVFFFRRLLDKLDGGVAAEAVDAMAELWRASCSLDDFELRLRGYQRVSSSLVGGCLSAGRDSADCGPWRRGEELAGPSVTFLEPWGERSWLVWYSKVRYSNKRRPHVECVGANVWAGFTASLSRMRWEQRQKGVVCMWTVDGVTNGGVSAHFTVAYHPFVGVEP